MHGIKILKDANNDEYSVTSLGKKSLKHHTKLASSHISREDFLSAGPVLSLALSTSDIWQHNDTLRIVFKKEVNISQ